ncbi:nSTAND1 domain-containing NTPase [Goodfellowiella coeruleoviolacea]|uniref:WD40 repeat n=1 Tax=Goodfellowiella coeruleoviolacea TaxID=334858 RepID=A0AAE3GBH5_9PSEU|nr:hypothetical protein [Goodfellowiella coeruleoviolacea]MCP2164334.1 WD40 repeat [Goodfellowiella coeruleoviolacea]
MGRPERTIDPAKGPLQRFAFELRQLRETAGRPSYRELAKRSHYSVTVLSEAAGGSTFPTLAVTLAYAEACGADRASWQANWERTAAELAEHRDDNQDAAPDNPPYLGLSPFRTTDAPRFHGRGALVARLRTRVLDTPLLAVFGASGAGISSLLRAGLLPALADCHTVLITPSDYFANPVAHQRKLSELLPNAGTTTAPGPVGGRTAPTHTVLVVDQFEEVFADGRDERDRDELVDELLAFAACPEHRVVLAARASVTARCAALPRLGPALAGNGLLVGPMSREELAEAISKPATDAGVRVEQALVEAVTADAMGQPGALALTAHAMREVWRRHRGRTLGVATYHELGGIPGLLAARADEVYLGFSPAERATARELLLRLTACPTGADHVPRRVPQAELLGDRPHHRAARVLAELTRARLVCVERDGVVLAHDALLREWPRMRLWLSEDRHLLRWHQQLSEDATNWQRYDQDSGFLYRGARLAAYHDFPATRLNHRERAFLAASRKVEASERTARRARRITLATALSLVLLLAGVTGLAYSRASSSTAAQQTASSRQLASSALAELPVDPELGLLLARTAVDIAPTEDAATALRQAVVDTKIRAVLPTGQGAVSGVAYSPDGRWLATSGMDGTIRIWPRDTSRDAAPRVLRAGEATHSPVFSPDGGLVATATAAGDVLVWDLNGDGSPRLLRGHVGAVRAVRFSPDGRLLASAGDDGSARLWDVASGHELRVFRGHDKALGVAFSPDGRQLATTGSEGAIRLWPTEDGAEPNLLASTSSAVQAVAFSPDGDRVATAGMDGTIRMWPLSTASTRVVLRGRADAMAAVAFSPDGERVAGAGADGTVWIWPADGGEPVALPGHRSAVAGVVFSPDGLELASAGADGTVRVFDPTGLGAQQVFHGHTGPVTDVAVSPDGRRAASGGVDGTVRVWPLSGGDPVVFTAGAQPVSSVAFSPDGTRLAASVADGTVRLWQVEGAGQPLVLAANDHGSVRGVAFSPDGQLLAGGGDDGVVRIWPADGSRPPVLLGGHDGGIRDVTFSPDGTRVATAGNDGTVRISRVDGSGSAVSLSGHEHGPVWSVSFSPDGRWLASGGSDGTVRIWPTDGSTAPLVLRGHQSGPVWSVMFSPDENWLVSAGEDGTVRVWADDGNHQSFVLRGLGPSIAKAVFTPASDQLVTADDDGTVRVLHCDACAPLPEVRALADARTSRELTPAETQRFLDDTAYGN